MEEGETDFGLGPVHLCQEGYSAVQIFCPVSAGMEEGDSDYGLRIPNLGRKSAVGKAAVLQLLQAIGEAYSLLSKYHCQVCCHGSPATPMW